ncbi:MAG: hypothetical protein HYX76_00615 [Acidobacteria bacterium]|nr:hypothetical protein [Acidobacteriota bacterium]
MKKLAAALLVLALGAVCPSPVAAQGKIRIAIWDFENNAPTSWWFWKDMGPAARNHIDTAMSENSTLSGRFIVIEREKLDLVLKEQGLATAGAVDPQTAAKVGRLLGVKYIVTGGIDKFAINSTQGRLPTLRGLGGNVVTAEATVNLRFIDTTTAERVIAIAADGEVKKGGGFARGASLSQSAEWGVASETIEKASKAIVEKLVSGGYLDRLGAAAAITEGKIIKVDGQRAWINLGASSGVKVGDTFVVVDVGEALIDPDSGQKLGADEKQTASGEVVEAQEKFAVIQFTGTAKAKDTVRRK